MTAQRRKSSVGKRESFSVTGQVGHAYLSRHTGRRSQSGRRPQRRGGARLELFHDLSTPIYVDTQLGCGESLADLTRATRATALGRLERIAEPLRKRGLKVTTAAVWDFPPYEAVIRRAMAIRADLIVALRAPLHAVHVQAPWVSEIADRRSLLARNAKAAGIKASRLHLLEGDPDADAAAGVHDLKDEAFAYLLANLANSELAHAREELAAIQTALQRIAEGSYGTCGDCNGAIGRARLLARPSADRYLSCQERAESPGLRRTPAPRYAGRYANPIASARTGAPRPPRSAS